ncbi:hypothetical protein ACIRBX_33970 [Kitasatospora sp. NPDC096147]|uniref:hypothetical protein n=1 Tax=Kitasatospora sp. NPDC096147 TaxID=3364093 RepID=UPI0037F8D9A3
MEMRTIIAEPAEEAERQQRDKSWEPTDADRALAVRTAPEPAASGGPAELQQPQPAVERLEDLREALAVMAIATSGARPVVGRLLVRSFRWAAGDGRIRCMKRIESAVLR